MAKHTSDVIHTCTEDHHAIAATHTFVRTHAHNDSKLATSATKVVMRSSAQDKTDNWSSQTHTRQVKRPSVATVAHVCLHASPVACQFEASQSCSDIEHARELRRAHTPPTIDKEQAKIILSEEN